MALTKKAQAKEPSLVPTLEGEYDCIWFVRKGTNYKVIITRLKTEEEAKAFCEQKAVDQVIDKIRSWYSQQEFIRYQLTDTDHMNIKPNLERLGRAIDKLQKTVKNRKELSMLLQEHIIDMIDVCKPSKRSKFRFSTIALLADLNSYCKRILSE